MALAYADLRAYMNRLDAVCGLDWAVSYTPWGDKLICHLTVAGMTRSSTGEPDSASERQEISGTVAEAQAFKRACAMFGLGRYLYTLPTVWVEYDEKRQAFNDKALARLTGIITQHYQRQSDNRDVSRETSSDADAEVDFGMGGEKNPFNDPSVGVRAEQPIDPALQKKLNILNSLGNTFYNSKKGDTAWDAKREELAKPFGAASSTALTGEQLDQLIAGLEKRTREILAQMGGVPSKVVQESTAYGKFAGVDSIDRAKGVGLAKCLQWAKANRVPA